MATKDWVEAKGLSEEAKEEAVDAVSVGRPVRDLPRERPTKEKRAPQGNEGGFIMSVVQLRSQDLQFRGQDLFQHLRPDQVNTLSEAAEEISLGPGQTVYQRGDPNEFLYVVLEGQVNLTMPQSEGVRLLIDEVGEGAMFGYGACLQLETYSLTATCIDAARLLKIKVEALKGVMGKDLIMGCAIQTHISRVYFRRYLATMNKLQAIAHSVPLA